MTTILGLARSAGAASNDDKGKPAVREIDPSAAVARQGSRSGSFRELFGGEAMPELATTGLKTAQITAARFISSAGAPRFSSPMAIENAYLVGIQLHASCGSAFWRGGSQSAGLQLQRGSVTVAHLEDGPAFRLDPPSEAVFLHIPHVIFEELARDYGAPRIGGLKDADGAVDFSLHHLAGALVPALDDPRHANRHVFEHIAIAICLGLATRHGGSSPQGAVRRGGLSTRQEKLAKELLVSSLTDQPSIAEIAQACGMPVSRFFRAFHQATGMPPYRWLRAFRVERAKDLLLNSSESLADIAYQCGFADQSHFTRLFAAAVGCSPGAWRRAQGAASGTAPSSASATRQVLAPTPAENDVRPFARIAVTHAPHGAAIDGNGVQSPAGDRA